MFYKSFRKTRKMRTPCFRFKDMLNINKNQVILTALIVALCAFWGIAGAPQNPNASDDELAQNLLEAAYKYRLKGRFNSAETVLRSGIKAISLQKDGEVPAASLKVELARVIIRKNFHNNTSDEEALNLYRDAQATAIKVGNKRLEGKAIYGIGFYQFKLGTKFWDQALLSLSRSLKIRREIGDDFGISQSTLR